MNTKHLWILPLATAAVVLPVKLYAAFHLVDEGTGFYKDGGKLAAAAAVLSLIGIILSFVLTHGEELPPRPFAPFYSTGAGVLAAFSAVFISGQSLVNLLDWNPSGVQTFGGITVMDSIFAASGFLGAIPFLMAAYDFVSGETTLRRHPLAALLSSVWGCLGLIALFVNYASAVNRFENIYHTFTVAFLLLFLFSQAEFLSGTDRENGAAQLVPYGCGAFILAVTDSVPNVARLLAGRKTLGIFPPGLYFVNLVLAVYAAVYLSAFRRQGRTEAFAVPAPAANRERGTARIPGPTAQKAAEPASAVDGGTELDDCLLFLRSAYPGREHFAERPAHRRFSPEKTGS